jgi:hypothetical protein
VIESRRLLGFCIRSTGEDSSILLHSLLPLPISILLYAGFLNPFSLLRHVLTIHVASRILILQHFVNIRSASLVKLPINLGWPNGSSWPLLTSQKCHVFPVPTYGLFHSLRLKLFSFVFVALVGGWRWYSWHTRLALNYVAVPNFLFVGVESFVDVLRSHVLYANQGGLIHETLS